jgi:hypothetical protein
MVSPDAADPFIAPCQQEAVTEQTSSSLSLTAVRAVTERGDLKDRPREVETLLPRKCLFASERHLCHQAMQIGYKTPLPTLTQGITGFRVPLHSPICSLSLLFSPTKFSTNKIFLTSAVRVCLCFHSQSRLKNPEHLKFLCKSSVHHPVPPVTKCPSQETF